MPRYLVEREFPEGLHIPVDDAGTALQREMIQNNADDGVTWIHSYVSADRRHSFCIYDAPTPEVLRRAAARNKLPLARITEVRVLTPYAYR